MVVNGDLMDEVFLKIIGEQRFLAEQTLKIFCYFSFAGRLTDIFFFLSFSAIGATIFVL